MSVEAEVFDRRFQVSEPAEFVLTDINGTVTVSSWDLPEIHVSGAKRIGGFLPWVTPDEGFRATRVEMEQQGSRVVVRATRTQEGFWGFMNWLGGAATVDYSVRVPRNCNVVIDLVSGSLSVQGVRGSVIVRTVSANCSLRSLDGKVVANTVSGSVVAEDVVGQAAFKTVGGAVGVREGRYLGLSIGSVAGDFSIDAALSPDGRYEFQTVSGTVRLAVPTGLRCVADVQSFGGSVRSDLPGNVTETKRGTWHAEVGPAYAEAIRVRMNSMSGGLRIVEHGYVEPAREAATASRAEPASSESHEPVGSAPASGGSGAPTTAPSREELMMLVLAAVERGELTVDEAAAKLNELDRLTRGEESTHNDGGE
jgi:hypothetical protein